MTSLAVALVLTLEGPRAGAVDGFRAPSDESRPVTSAETRFHSWLDDSLAVVAWPLSLGRKSLLPVAAIGVGFLLFGHDVALYRSFDRKVRWTFRGRSVFDFTAILGDGLFDLAVVGAFAVGDERARRTSIEGVEALVSVAATSFLAKRIFRVARPSHDPDHKSYFGRFSHDAFPSGHAMSAFATASVLATEYPWVAPYAYGAATLTGLSVMKRRWHWLSDVIVGSALGIIIGQTSIAVNARRLSVAPIEDGVAVRTSL